MSLYAAGITISDQGGAFVAIEKRPRNTGRTMIRSGEKEDVWEDVLRVVGVERLSGTVPEIVAHLATRLRTEPMLDDTNPYVDVGAIGKPVLRLFADQRMYPWAVVIGGEHEATDKKSCVTTVPVRVLQGIATMMLQSGRLEVVRELGEGPTLLRALEQLEALPQTGPSRDLGIAAGLAVWAAHNHRSCGPWASRKPAPKDLDIEWMRKARQYAIRRAEAVKAGRPWWRALDDPEW